MDAYTIRPFGQREYAETKDGITKHTRKFGETEWKPIDSPPPPPTSTQSPLQLHLIREKQAEGEPHHWSLFVAREGQSLGNQYQVTGDATMMRYVHATDVDILKLDSINSIYLLEALKDEDEDVVAHIAETEVPPYAENRAAVKENCQGWCVRVVDKLIEELIVNERWHAHLVEMLQPV
ncbi:hypothetical protein EJ08DRAFT_318325 [Tothia fuscella]|uniref:Uncharacterized protein n=1 Tax=Tothia fuscella TaxID=1048955 RepID=A0A9P4NNG2_9PEZI|nr:hypothetical protein EJ08DRAFT_318325 [Tothia fuscella]